MLKIKIQTPTTSDPGDAVNQTYSVPDGNSAEDRILDSLAAFLDTHLKGPLTITVTR